MKKDFDLASIGTESSGLDAFLASEPSIVTPGKVASATPHRVRVGSLSQISGFVRVSSDTLVNKATQDLWALKKEGDDYFIERLFQDDGQPVKG